MRIGLFGGTFNPVHYGHLENCRSILEEFSLDKIIFVPSHVPVHKKIRGRVSPADRMNMLKLAIGGEEGFEVSDIEIRNKRPSYTIDTLTDLLGLYPEDELLLIIGSDSFNELHTWKSYRLILELVRVIVVLRPGSTELREDLKGGKGILFSTGRMMDISSTEIRRLASLNRDFSSLTLPAVRDYIISGGLYSS